MVKNGVAYITGYVIPGIKVCIVEIGKLILW